MVKIVGIRFKKGGKIYYFDPCNCEIKKDAPVIVETTRGVEYGIAVVGVKEVSEETLVTPLKPVIRAATLADLKKHEENKLKEVKALKICEEKVAKHGLDMNLVEVEYTFDNSKIIFYFTADGRIDFRELVKDLASVFRTRIELRQIGVRDEAKKIGGIGACGRSLCCANHLGDFIPVSIKMAKEQGLSLNPTKISGACGRLMCCLKYEQDGYEYLLKKMPRLGALVSVPEGEGEVVQTFTLKEMVRVKMKNLENNQIAIRDYNISDIKILKQGRHVEELEKIDIKELKKLED